MKKKCLCLLVLLATCLAPQVASATELWIADIRQALALAEHRDRFLLVDLYADWCHWCKLLEREVFSTHRFQQFADQFVLLRVDTEDGGQGSRFMQQIGSPGLPTTLILTPRMVTVARVEGYLATELYLRLLARPGITPEQELSARFRLVNSLRLSRRFDEAETELEKARALAQEQRNGRLLEHLDLLAADLARERGDCRAAMTHLQTFIDRYPESSLRPQARRTLYTLRTNEESCS